MCHISSDNSKVDDTHLAMLKISFNALSGEYSPRMLRLKGSYQGHTINNLVDSGSSFNFIKPKVARCLSIPSAAIAPFKVFVGSGNFIWCSTLSSNIPILVQGVSLPVDLHHLVISSADMVFGLSWLQGLGHVLTDYNFLPMEFIYRGTPALLHAEHLLHTDLLKNRCIQKMLLDDDICLVYSMHLLRRLGPLSLRIFP